MKTVRFSNVVAQCGKPIVHLVFTDPARDRELQTAVKGHRVMTVFQPDVGHSADRGEVGFEPGPGRQFLVFPKSLKPFMGARVVGIKYDLLETPVVPKSQRIRVLPARPPRQAPTKPSKTLAEAFAEIAGKPRAKESRPKAKPRKSGAKVAGNDLDEPPKEGGKSQPDGPGRARPKTKPQPEAKATIAKERDALKRGIRRATKLLEAGKTVAAFNLLNGLLADEE